MKNTTDWMLMIATVLAAIIIAIIIFCLLPDHHGFKIASEHG